MFVRKILFKCDVEECGVEEYVDTYNQEKTPFGWATIEFKLLQETKEIRCSQHLCPHHALRLGLTFGETGWYQNDVAVDSSPIKQGANPKPLEPR